MALRYFFFLLIFLLTFEVGAVVTLTLERFTLSEDERIEIEEVVTEPKTFKSCVNDDGIRVKAFYAAGEWSTEPSPFIGLENQGTEPIYFFVRDDGEIAYVQVRSATADAVNACDLVWTDEREIKPTDSYAFPLPVADNGEPFSITIRYRRGKNRVERFITTHFSGGSLQDGCY